MIKPIPQCLQLFSLFYGRLSLGNTLHNPNKVSCICRDLHAAWNGYSTQTAAAWFFRRYVNIKYRWNLISVLRLHLSILVHCQKILYNCRIIRNGILYCFQRNLHKIDIFRKAGSKFIFHVSQIFQLFLIILFCIPKHIFRLQCCTAFCAFRIQKLRLNRIFLKHAVSLPACKRCQCFETQNPFI